MAFFSKHPWLLLFDWVELFLAKRVPAFSSPCAFTATWHTAVIKQVNLSSTTYFITTSHFGKWLGKALISCKLVFFAILLLSLGENGFRAPAQMKLPRLLVKYGVLELLIPAQVLVSKACHECGMLSILEQWATHSIMFRFPSQHLIASAALKYSVQDILWCRVSWQGFYATLRLLRA